MPDQRSPFGARQLPPALKPFERPLGDIWRAMRAASYPLRGIWYFLRNREFYPLFLSRLLPLSIISVLVYLILFTFTFLPQLALLAIFQGRSAWFNATILVLGEGLVVIQGLFEGFFVDETRVDVFDATMIKCGRTDLVAPHRILFSDAPTAVKSLGKPTSSAIYTPWSLVQIVELIVCLPLNFIPVFGGPAFIMITGTRLGKLAHYRWFQLRGLTKKEAKREIKRRTWEYVWFGTVAMVLELIPIFSFFFLLTTTAGSALWAVRLEELDRPQLLEDDVEDAEEDQSGAPPPYEDDPV